METRVLILGGTSEARALADLVHAAGVQGVLSYAGRVERPRPTALPHRIGGFGGVDGLVNWIRDNGITHLVDATHPFAAKISTNAVRAAAVVDVPLVALSRPPWVRMPEDRWTEVPDITAAVAALDGAPQRVMLAIGRQNLPAFAGNPQHHYLLRLVDPPETPPPFPDYAMEISRGPFTFEGDLALLRRHQIDIIVAKNAGGAGARAKLDAARALGLPVIMIARPAVPDRHELSTPQDVLRWITHGQADRGV